MLIRHVGFGSQGFFGEISRCMDINESDANKKNMIPNNQYITSDQNPNYLPELKEQHLTQFYLSFACYVLDSIDSRNPLH